MELRHSKNLFENDFRDSEVVPGITFPCYKSLNEFIDLDELRMLDSYLVERIKRHIKTRKEDYFLSFCTNLKKPFYLLNQNTDEKKYVETYTAWFDAVNQYHGCDGADGLTLSIRVDGKFTRDFRKLIPKPEFNRASAPALWVCVSSE